MDQLENSPNHLYSILHNHQEAQLLFSALRLNIFSYLDDPVPPKTVADALESDERKVRLLLLSLVSCGFVERLGDLYVNTPQTKAFLSRQSQVYLGDSLLFREKMTSLSHLEQKLHEGNSPKKATYDFEELARASIPEMYAGRVQPFLEKMASLYPDSNRPLRILDLGGGTGILAIEFTKHFPKSKATVFEMPSVAAITEKVIREHHAQADVSLLSGDFNKDSLEGPYDMIIASGILNFVTIDLCEFIQKMASALIKGGHLLVVGRFSDQHHDAPPNMVGWLSGFLDGIPLPPDERSMTRAFQKAGFSSAGSLSDGIFEGQLYRKDGFDAPVTSDDVIRSFIELTEKISNSKTNVLYFGSEEMTFYRGEIHMIKMIGDMPGIHSAELARKFGITRAVVHKTLQKLSDRELITKEEDPTDKKRFLLYLTDKGKTAYGFHEEYHAKSDQAIFEYLAGMTGEQSATINGFLEHAIRLIQNHA